MENDAEGWSDLDGIVVKTSRKYHVELQRMKEPKLQVKFVPE